MAGRVNHLERPLVANDDDLFKSQRSRANSYLHQNDQNDDILADMPDYSVAIPVVRNLDAMDDDDLFGYDASPQRNRDPSGLSRDMFGD